MRKPRATSLLRTPLSDGTYHFYPAGTTDHERRNINGGLVEVLAEPPRFFRLTTEIQIQEPGGWEGPLDKDGCATPTRVPSIGISNFVRHQTPQSHMSHWTCSDADLVARTCDALPDAFVGYRWGVLQVPIDPDGIWSSVVALQPGMRLQGVFAPREPGEEPRIEMFTLAPKQPAGSAWVILYHRHVLTKVPTTACEWEIISVNGSPNADAAPPPMHPSTLMANHFGFSGGTPTGMSPEEFERELRACATYWRDKVQARQPDFIEEEDHVA